MARIRNIKPEFFMSEKLASLSSDARLAFIGLWTHADCEGRLKDRPKRLRLELFPYHTSVNMDKILSDLAGVGNIFRYSVDGEDYIEIKSFKKHQYISGKEREKGSTIPGRDWNGSVIDRSSDIIKDNGQRTTDNGQPKSHPGFDVFWSAYPRREGKPKASQAWQKLRPDLDAVLASLERQKASEQWTKDGGQFIPMPATYLNQRRWEDEPARPSESNDPFAGITRAITPEEADELVKGVPGYV